MGFLTQLNGIDFGSLGLLERVLLVSDGTLTDLFEAAFLEPIALVKVSVDIFDSTGPVEDLEVGVGSPVMRRQILLQGENSGTNYVFGDSLIALEALDPDFREELVASTHPMGRLWVLHKLETRKEILRIWRGPAGELSGALGVTPETALLSRTYRVISRGRPIMLITESFRG